MSGISDEMLMAYVDDELSPEDRAQVEAYLRKSPDGAERLAVFSQTSRGLGGLFDAVLDAEVPQRLIDAARGETASAVVVDLADRRRLRSGRESVAGRLMTPGRSGYALAASLAAVAIVAGAAFYAIRSQTGPDGDVFAVVANGQLAPLALATVLESGPSGMAATVASEGAQLSVKPVFSFATEGSGYCRQYMIDGGGRGAIEGVACRRSEGQWQIKRQVALSGPIAAQATDKIVPAGRDGAPEIEALVDAMISGDVLGVEDEKRLIDGAWTPPQR